MKKRPVCLVCIGLMIAIWICHTCGVPVFGEPAVTAEERKLLEEGQRVFLSGKITDRRITEDTVRYTLRHSRVTLRGRHISFPKLFVSTEYHGSAALPGDELEAWGDMRPLEAAANPGQFDQAGYYASQGIYYRVWAEETTCRKGGAGLARSLFCLRERLTAAYAGHMAEDTAGILAAMVMGDRALLTEDSRRNFQVGGCLHLLVISGLHIMLLGMSVLKLLLYLRLPQKPAGALAALIMVSYTALTGSPVAAVRACLMFLIYLLARVKHLSYDSACAMAVTAICMLLVRPGCLFHAGFQLSFSAALGASVIAPVFGKALPWPGSSGWKAESRKKAGKGELGKKIGKALWESTVSWGAIQLTTLPLMMYYFYELPLWGLPLNLLLGPFVQYILVAGAAGSLGAFLFPGAASWLLLPVHLGLRLYDGILGLARRLPCSTFVCGQPAAWQILVYYGGFLLLVYFLTVGRSSYGRMGKRQRLRGALAGGLAILCLMGRRYPAFSLTMLDVGQGDCLILQTGKHVFLSDGGSTNVSEVGKYRILPYLQSRGIGRVEAVFLSHDDADHINGIEEILELAAEKKTSLRIGYVFMPAWMSRTEDGARILSACRRAGTAAGLLERGDGLQCGKLQIEVLHPFQQEKAVDGRPYGGAQSGNAGSLVLKVGFDRFTALLTGDLEQEGEEELIPYLTRIDCLKVAHHGSRNSTSEAMLDVLQPELALVSAPKKSFYGHPHRETLDRLQAAGAEILMTKDSGAVSLTGRSGGFRIEQYSASQKE